MGFSFLDLIFPKICVGCGRFGMYLCNVCKAAKKLHRLQICPSCERNAFEGVTHSWCKKKTALNGVISVFEYKPPISNLIKKLKYRHSKDVVLTISEWLSEELRLARLSKRPFVLVPIPLHTLRENWRGFNHAALLGEQIARSIGWKYNPELLDRVKLRKAQARLKSREREKNVEGVFLANHEAIKQSNRQILLFDDVWTTGSTMKEAAKVLKQAGARQVWGLTIAR